MKPTGIFIGGLIGSAVQTVNLEGCQGTWTTVNGATTWKLVNVRHGNKAVEVYSYNEITSREAELRYGLVLFSDAMTYRDVYGERQ